MRESGKTMLGAQKGHPASALKKVACPGEIKVHELPSDCEMCGSTLDMGQATVRAGGRQVIDLPPVRVKVTEHRVQSVRCNWKIPYECLPRGRDEGCLIWPSNTNLKSLIVRFRRQASPALAAQ